MKKYKILEFLQEDNGKLSSVRLFAFFIIASYIIEWMHFIFTMPGVFNPNISNIGLIAAIMSAKVIQKNSEQNINT